MIADLRKTPFPWFGGKADAAAEAVPDRQLSLLGAE